jgi:hypothetical protein
MSIIRRKPPLAIFPVGGDDDDLPPLAAKHPVAQGSAWPGVQYMGIPPWCALTGMSRSGTYRAIADDHIIAIKCGNRTLVDVQSGLRWLRSLPRVKLRRQTANQ